MIEDLKTISIHRGGNLEQKCLKFPEYPRIFPPLNGSKDAVANGNWRRESLKLVCWQPTCIIYFISAVYRCVYRERTSIDTETQTERR